ncbi:hypothetical protein FB451DRAFT_1184992 [Mycena latifolia]|nr:hypothetical protein FB451DRAFT_1184992 [Mycena latifolia]
MYIIYFESSESAAIVSDGEQSGRGGVASDTVRASDHGPIFGAVWLSSISGSSTWTSAARHWVLHRAYDSSVPPSAARINVSWLCNARPQTSTTGSAFECIKTQVQDVLSLAAHWPEKPDVLLARKCVGGIGIGEADEDAPPSPTPTTRRPRVSATGLALLVDAQHLCLGRDAGARGGVGVGHAGEVPPREGECGRAGRGNAGARSTCAEYTEASVEVDQREQGTGLGGTSFCSRAWAAGAVGVGGKCASPAGSSGAAYVISDSASMGEGGGEEEHGAGATSGENGALSVGESSTARRVLGLLLIEGEAKRSREEMWWGG